MIDKLLLLFCLVAMGVKEGASHSCGENKIPFGLEVAKDGVPTLLCSKPDCFEKTYADCDERALRRSCKGRSWLGGFEKSVGTFAPLYVQCCDFEDFDKLSSVQWSSVKIRPGEFFEGEEIQNKLTEETTAVDLITDMRIIRDGKNVSYEVDVARFRCGEIPRPGMAKEWSWP